MAVLQTVDYYVVDLLYTVYIYSMSGYSYILKMNVVYTVMNAHAKYTLIPYKELITSR